MSKPKLQTFKCEKCGGCCRDTRKKIAHYEIGLWLLPHETRLFARRHVKPYFAFGVKGKTRPRPKRIAVYQMAQRQCPHLKDDNTCSMYPAPGLPDDRPLICQAHPLTISNAKGYFDVTVDAHCPATQQFINSKAKLSSIFPGSMINACSMMNVILSRVLSSPEQAWLFDLKRNRWIKLTRTVMELMVKG